MGQAMNFEKWYKTAKEKIGFPANAESLELSLREVVGEVLSQNLKLKTENKKLKAKLKDFEKMKNCSNLSIVNIPKVKKAMSGARNTTK